MHLSKFCYQTETNSDEEEEVNRLPVIKPANKYVEKINKYLTILNKCDENLQILKDDAKYFDISIDKGTVDSKSYAIFRILSYYGNYFECKELFKNYIKELIYYFESIDDKDYNKRTFTSKNEIFQEFEKIFSIFELNAFIYINGREPLKMDEFCNKIKMKDSAYYYNEKELSENDFFINRTLNKIKIARTNINNLIIDLRLLSEYFNNNYKKFSIKNGGKQY
jgi:hypothetical protein